jgi:hypothetical protein
MYRITDLDYIEGQHRAATRRRSIVPYVSSKYYLIIGWDWRKV